MKLATIDLGTNTALLLIAETTPNNAGLRAIKEEAEIIRLGEGLDQSGVLADAAMERAITALEKFAATIAHHACERVAAVTTEAVRKAGNADYFVARANNALASASAELVVIDGDREAELSWRAIRDAFPQLKGPRTVVDIGGGSTEIIVGSDTQIEAKTSLPIGSVRLHERLMKHDPPTMQELTATRIAVDEALKRGPKPRGTIVGVAGTVTTLAAMAQQLTHYDPTRVHGMRLTSSDVVRLVDTMAGKAVAERRLLPGLHPKRADVIVAGAIILERVLEYAGWADCVVSDRGIRWGLAAELAARTA